MKNVTLPLNELPYCTGFVVTLEALPLFTPSLTSLVRQVLRFRGLWGALSTDGVAAENRGRSSSTMGRLWRVGALDGSPKPSIAMKTRG